MIYLMQRMKVYPHKLKNFKKGSNNMEKTVKICPMCFKAYNEPSALSRKDNKTEICPICGTKEALESFNLSDDKIKELIERIYTI